MILAWMIILLCFALSNVGVEAGKFRLDRMMKNEMELMGKTNRIATLDKLHKALPFLDKDDDKYTQELKQ